MFLARWSRRRLALPALRLLARRPRLVPAGLHQDDRRAAVHQHDDVFDIEQRVTEQGPRRVHRPRQLHGRCPTPTGVDALLTGEIIVAILAPGGVQRAAAGDALRADARRRASSSRDVQGEQGASGRIPSMQFREELRRHDRQPAHSTRARSSARTSTRSSASPPSSRARSSARSSKRSDAGASRVSGRAQADRASGAPIPST